MKKLLIYVVLLILYSCEDVIDVELEESEPRLVVEASLLWNVDRTENVQVIRLTTTAPYFQEEVPAAPGATVAITTETGERFEFTEVEDGIFSHEEIPPLLDTEYQLHITFNNEVYIAREQMITVPELDHVEQDIGGFSGDDYEFRVYFKDPADMENYYLFRYINERITLQIYNDEFTNGNYTYAFFNDEEAEPEDLVGFQIQGISKGFYDYMFILRSQSGSNNAGPFQTQPGIVRGNIVNTTNPENFAFGYFRLSATNFLAYEVK